MASLLTILFPPPCLLPSTLPSGCSIILSQAIVIPCHHGLRWRQYSQARRTGEAEGQRSKTRSKVPGCCQVVLLCLVESKHEVHPLLLFCYVMSIAKRAHANHGSVLCKRPSSPMHWANYTP